MKKVTTWITSLSLVLMIGVPVIGWAQVQDLDKVEMNLGSRTFEKAPPFDVPFVITGKAPKGVLGVSVQYRINDDSKWIWFDPCINGNLELGLISDCEGANQKEETQDDQEEPSTESENKEKLKFNSGVIKLENSNGRQLVKVKIDKKSDCCELKFEVKGDTTKHFQLCKNEGRISEVMSINGKDSLLKVQTVGNRKSCHYFPSEDKIDDEGFTLPVEWTRFAGGDDEQKFCLLNGPIHPNVNYEFRVKVRREVEATEVTAMKNQIYGILKNEIAGGYTLDSLKFTQTWNPDKIKEKITNKIEKLVEKEGCGSGSLVLDPCAQVRSLDCKDCDPCNRAEQEETFTIQLDQPPFKSTVDKLAEIGLAAKVAEKNCEKIPDLLTKSGPGLLKQTSPFKLYWLCPLEKIIADPNLLSPKDKATWKAPLFKSHPDVTMNKLASSLKEAENLVEITKGTRRIDSFGTLIEIEDAVGPDPFTIKLVAKFLEVAENFGPAKTEINCQEEPKPRGDSSGKEDDQKGELDDWEDDGDFGDGSVAGKETGAEAEVDDPFGKDYGPVESSKDLLGESGEEREPAAGLFEYAYVQRLERAFRLINEQLNLNEGLLEAGKRSNKAVHKLMYDSKEPLLYLDLSTTRNNELRSIISDLNDGTIILESNGVKWNEDPVSSGLGDLRALSYKQLGGELVKELRNRPEEGEDLFIKLFLGEAKIEKVDNSAKYELKSSEKPHLPSLLAIKYFFKKLDGLKNNRGNRVFPGVTSELNAIDAQLSLIQKEFEANPDGGLSGNEIIKAAVTQLLTKTNALFFTRASARTSRPFSQVLSGIQDTQLSDEAKVIWTAPVAPNLPDYSTLTLKDAALSLGLALSNNKAGVDRLLRGKAVLGKSGAITSKPEVQLETLEFMVILFNKLSRSEFRFQKDQKKPIFHGFEGEFPKIIFQLNQLKQNQTLVRNSKFSPEVLEKSKNSLLVREIAPLYDVPSGKPAIYQKLISILNDPTKLADAAKNSWGGSYNFETGVTAVPVAKVGEIVVNGLLDGHSMESILEGKAKITDQGLVPTNKRHAPSIQALYSFYQLLLSNGFQYNGGKGKVFEGYEAELNNVLIYLNALQRCTETLDSSKTKLDETLKSDFPNVFEDYLLQQTYHLNGASRVELMDQDKKASPYVGLDFGTAFVPKLSTVFLYYGANFYLVPVNKKARQLDLKKCDFLLKNISFFGGMAVSAYGTPENLDGYTGFTAAGNPMAGAGARVFRILRVSGGVMWYKQENTNPIISEKVVRRSGFVAVSADINVVEALGKVGTLFGLVKQ